MKRFTQNELFELRNQIPINALIEERLKMPAKISEGHFRFLCPLCGEFQTAINPKTNLARCFRCEKNFNTIDMVMTCEKATFVETVNILKAYRQKLKQKPHHRESNHRRFQPMEITFKSQEENK